MKTKLNCREGNSQCGKKCQPNHYKCPSEKGLEASVATDKFTSLVAEVPTPSPKDLESLFGDYEKLISSEGKKMSRAKIKGLPNEKLLKKELLRAEEKAWVFVRLMREKNRLAKKGEEVGELEALLQKIADGDAEALAESLMSLETKTAEKRKTKTETKISEASSRKLDKMASIAEENTISSKKFFEFREKTLQRVSNALSSASLEFLNENLNSFEELKTQIESLNKKAIEKNEGEKTKLGLSENKRVAQAIIDALSSIPIKRLAEPPTADKRDAKQIAEVINDKITFLIAKNLSLFEDRDEEFDTKEMLARKMTYAFYGDSTKKIKSIGNESLRGKSSIPPIPNAFAAKKEPVSEGLRNFLEEAKVMVQVPAKRLSYILSDGGVKNMFEVSKSDEENVDMKGYEANRRSAERKILHIKTVDGADNRPVYGYLESPHHFRSAPEVHGTAGYGDVQIVLKDDIKKRSTASIGDSFWAGGATPILNPTKEIYGQKGEYTDAEYDGGSIVDISLSTRYGGKYYIRDNSYIEAQIFGGVKLEDIDFIILPPYIFEQFPKLLDMLKKAGVAFEFSTSV